MQVSELPLWLKLSNILLSLAVLRWGTEIATTPRSTSPCATSTAVPARRRPAPNWVTFVRHACETRCVLGNDVWNPCGATDVPAQSAIVSPEAQEEDAEEDVYEYDCPRAVAPPPPTRRTLSDISGPSTAFGALSIDSLDTGTFPTPSHIGL